MQAWLSVLDSYNIIAVSLHPVAGSATWLIAESVNVSAYDAGYIAVAKAKGLPLWTRDNAVCNKAPRVSVKTRP